MGAGTQVAGQVRGPSGEEGRQGRGLLCHRHDNAILSFPDPPNRLYMPAGQHRSGLPDHPCAMLVLTMPLTMPLVMPLTMPLTMPLNVPLTMPLPHHPESLSVNLPAPAPPPPSRGAYCQHGLPCGHGGLHAVLTCPHTLPPGRRPLRLGRHVHGCGSRCVAGGQARLGIQHLAGTPTQHVLLNPCYPKVYRPKPQQT